jgi:hypothetical protein
MQDEFRVIARRSWRPIRDNAAYPFAIALHHWSGARRRWRMRWGGALRKTISPACKGCSLRPHGANYKKLPAPEIRFHEASQADPVIDPFGSIPIYRKSLDADPKSPAYPRRPAPSKRGASADRHENVGRDAMDANVLTRKLRASRSAFAADGEIVWSWHPWAGAKCAEDDWRATVTMRSRTPGRARR